MRHSYFRLFAAIAALTTTAQAQSPSTWGIIRDQIFAPQCASCHYEGSSFARQSGLVLTPDRAYEELVNQPPTNAAARADGLLRVGTKGLESLYTSYLWEKIDARNQEHFYTDHPLYGALMPLGGDFLTNGELALIERWIIGGAPENGLIPGADASLLQDTSRYRLPEFKELEPPGRGLQFRLGPFDVPPNRDRELFFREPLSQEEDLFVNRVEIAMRPGSHHFIFYLFDPAIPDNIIPQPQVIRDLYNASGGFNSSTLQAMQYHIFFAGTQWPLMNYHFPKGVALRLPKGLGLDLNSHYANRRNEVIQGEVIGNLHTVDPASVERIAEILSINNVRLFLLPRQITTVTYEEMNPYGENMNIFQLFSHAHEHMLEFRVEIIGGERNGELIYFANDWEHPPILEIDPPLVLAPDQGLRLITTYNNWTDRLITFGFRSVDEMQILFGYYYLGDIPTAAGSDDAAMPAAFALAPNYPNPFNPSTTLQYTLPVAGEVTIAVYDVNGRQVAEVFRGWQRAGSHRVVWHASGLPAGMYFAQLQAGDQRATRKILLLR